MPILALLTEVVAAIPTLISAGHDVYDLIAAAKEVIDSHSGEPDWLVLEGKIAELQAGALRDTTRDA